MQSPKISVMIPTYNCAALLRKTLASVLEQDLGPELMQIEVIDDCSSDHPEQVVAEVGKGRVGFYQQPQNVKHVKNFQTALQRAKGEIIHLLHGDDFVLPGFYLKTLEMYDSNPMIGACYSRHFFVDEYDNITGISELLSKNNTVLFDFHKVLVHGQKIQTPSITVKKSTYDQVGFFNPELSWTEDWEMWVRIAMHFPIGYINKPLACYRIHSNSSTGNKSITGENIKDLQRIQKVFESYLDTISEIKALQKSFKSILFNVASTNFKRTIGINHPQAYKHLIVMAKNAYSLRLSCFYLLKALQYFLIQKRSL
jgi:glycosyltransferase involved in cell wall biosynthesis